MKKIALYFFVMCAIALSTMGQEIPKKPNPQRLVNDYINLLTIAQRDSLENKLRIYNTKTSIQIALVITDNIGDYEPLDFATKILNSWGVGQRGIDNGLVFLFVKKDHISDGNGEFKKNKCAITPGYGLEGDFTDAETKRIIRDELAPYTKKKQYYEGFLHASDVIMKKLGSLGKQQREELKAMKKAKAREETKDVLLGIFVGVVLIVLAILFTILFVRLRKKYLAVQELKQQKNYLREYLAQLNKEQYQPLLLKKWNHEGTFPAWARESYEAQITQKDQLLKMLSTTFGECPSIIEQDTSAARKLIQQIETLLSNTEKCHATIKKLEAEVAEYAEKAVISVKTLAEEFLELQIYMQKKQHEKYLLTDYFKGITEIPGQLTELKKLVVAPDSDKKAVYESSQVCRVRISNTLEGIKSHLELQAKTKIILDGISTAMEKEPTEMLKAQTLLDQITSTAPRSSWENARKNFMSASNSMSKIQKQIALAVDLNSMGKQDFVKAAEEANTAKDLVREVFESYAAISRLDKSLKDAQANYANKLAEAQKYIKQAKSTVAHEDVGNDAKDKLKEAQDKLKQAENAKGSGLIDWLLVVTLLGEAVAFARAANSNAENDISNAAALRRRKQQQKNNSNNHNTYNTYSSYSRNDDNDNNKPYYSSPTKTDDSPTFSGFGGGGGGGGGASDDC